MVIAFVVAAIFSFIVCSFAHLLGGFLSVMDVPDGKRKLHEAPVPLIGGIASLLPVVFMAAFLAAHTDFTRLYAALSLGTLGLLLLGFADDRRNLPAIFRLVISVLFTGAALKFVPGLTVTFLAFSFDSQLSMGGPYFLGLFVGSIFTIACIVGLQNAVNMADGNNGIVTGMATVWALLLISYAPAHLLPLLITFVSCIGIVMIFNLAGRLFLGDAGTYGISMIIGLATIYIYNVNFTTLTADKVVLMFLLPVMDTIRLLVQRSFAGRSPLSSDRNHFHHILRAMWAGPQPIVIYLTMVCVPSVLARFFPSLTWLWTIIIIVLYVSIVLLHLLMNTRSGRPQLIDP